jgi:hypothetical protein
VAPRAPAVVTVPTSHSKPASRPSAAPVAPRPQRPSPPQVTRCADGSTVSGDQSCPTPEPSPRPNCPHVAVDGPVCGRESGGN